LTAKQTRKRLASEGDDNSAESDLEGKTTLLNYDQSWEENLNNFISTSTSTSTFTFIKLIKSWKTSHQLYNKSQNKYKRCTYA